jgi:hypothetical protein
MQTLFPENPNCQLIANGHFRIVHVHTKPEWQKNNSLQLPHILWEKYRNVTSRNQVDS